MRIMKSGYIRVNGVWYCYCSREAWGKIEHSFDGGRSYHTTKRKAFEVANLNGDLIRRTNDNGQRV